MRTQPGGFREPLPSPCQSLILIVDQGEPERVELDLRFRTDSGWCVCRPSCLPECVFRISRGAVDRSAVRDQVSCLSARLSGRGSRSRTYDFADVRTSAHQGYVRDRCRGQPVNQTTGWYHNLYHLRGG